jgi:hypothetical protein
VLFRPDNDAINSITTCTGLADLLSTIDVTV